MGKLRDRRTVLNSDSSEFREIVPLTWDVAPLSDVFVMVG